MTSQNELVHAAAAVERAMHARFPEAEQAELTETLRGYGAGAGTAARMAAAVSRDPDAAPGRDRLKHYPAVLDVLRHLSSMS